MLGHHRRYTKRTLSATLARAGFQTHTLKYTGVVGFFGLVRQQPAPAAGTAELRSGRLFRPMGAAGPGTRGATSSPSLRTERLRPCHGQAVPRRGALNQRARFRSTATPRAPRRCRCCTCAPVLANVKDATRRVPRQSQRSACLEQRSSAAEPHRGRLGRE